MEGQFSKWVAVLSGEPHGKTLNPTLFLLYIIDIVDDLVNTIFKFAADIKSFEPCKKRG